MRLTRILPHENSVIAKLARENGPQLMRQAIKAVVSGALVQEAVTEDSPGDAAPPKKPSLGQRMASAALLRVATKSVPGAILVGGGLLAKAV